MTMCDMEPDAAEALRKEARQTLKACLVYFRTRGFVPWEIAEKLCRDLTPGKMRLTAATLFDIGEAPVAEEVVRLADKAEAGEAREEARRKARTGTNTYYICDEDGAVLAIVEDVSYNTAMFQLDVTAEEYEIDRDSLDMLTEAEYVDRYGEGA